MNRAEAVLAEEFHHSAQHLAGGRIFYEGRAKTEGEAALVRDSVSRTMNAEPIKAYAAEKENFRGEYGDTIISFYKWERMKEYLGTLIDRFLSPFLPPSKRPAYAVARI